jgi:LmbE family N-acetylglucosaminyl deacetylase
MKFKKFNIKYMLIAALIFALLFCISFFAREYFGNLFAGFTMNEISTPGPGDRVLVFAAHSDDEALGAADLIRKSVQNGAKVKVVLATNGDGFARAVAIETANILPKPQDYINYGYQRQKESLAAMKLLGLKDEDVIFLGYPDRGIASMWSSNWMSSTPYKSRYTKTDKSPYNNSYSSQALYSGENLYNDITKIIDDFKPTHVVYPHPNDRHPDHWGVYDFVKFSLTSINYRPQHEWLYLVHRGDWPTPLKRNRNLYLSPPLSLLNKDTEWFSLHMSQEEIEAKAQALKKYTSQTKRIGLLMSAFERRNELFGVYPDAKLMQGLRKDSDIEPDDANQIIRDPQKDAINLEVKTSSDITDVHMELSAQNKLHAFIMLDGNADKVTTYYLNMIFMRDGQGIPLRLVVKNKNLEPIKPPEPSGLDVSGIELKISKDMLHIIIPNDKIGDYDHIFMNAESSISPYYMDRTAWRMVNVK